MTTTPPIHPVRRRPSRRSIVLSVAVVVVILMALALLATYLIFFASEAPAAPTLDDALKVLLPSLSPSP